MNPFPQKKWSIPLNTFVEVKCMLVLAKIWQGNRTFRCSFFGCNYRIRLWGRGCLWEKRQCVIFKCQMLPWIY